MSDPKLLALMIPSLGTLKKPQCTLLCGNLKAYFMIQFPARTAWGFVFEPSSSTFSTTRTSAIPPTAWPVVRKVVTHYLAARRKRWPAAWAPAAPMAASTPSTKSAAPAPSSSPSSSNSDEWEEPEWHEVRCQVQSQRIRSV